MRELSRGDTSFVLLAKRGNRPVGVIAVTDRNHVALLFVDSDLHGHGIGSHLLDLASEGLRSRYPDVTTLTVSSSPNSVSFYSHTGFTPLGAEIDEEGMRYTPMQRRLGRAS